MAVRTGELPRVLYLAFMFPPSRGSGVFRARATANHLARTGWDVTVVTAPREFFSYHLRGASDPSLEATVDPRVRVVRAGVLAYHWERDVRRFGALRRTFPLLTDRLYGLARAAVFPEHYLGWAPGVLRRCVAMHLRRRFDVIVATGNPFVSFALARALGRRLGVPYVVDYRDAWTYDQFTGEPRFPAGGRVMRAESRVVRDAAEILFVNDAMRERAARRYPFAAERMAVVRNGWDADLLDLAPPARPATGRPLRLAYVGTVTGAVPLDVLFAGWRRARAHPLLADAVLELHGHLGYGPHRTGPLRALIEAEADAGVRYRGPFDKTSAASVYAGADALVFCCGGGRYVTSAKVFEYVATARPVASVHEPGLAAEEVLRGYPLWYPAPALDPDGAAAALVGAARAAREAGPAAYEAAARHAASFTREAALAPWSARLRRLVGAPR